MPLSRTTGYRSLPNEESDDDGFGEPESSSSYPSRTASKASGTLHSPEHGGKILGLKQTKLVRPPLHMRDGELRLPNERYVYLLTGFVSLGALLFGYDQGVMGVIVADARWKELMRPENSWVTGAVISLYDVGCFVGAMSIGVLADCLGRERSLSLASLIFIVGAVIQAGSFDVPTITLGRIILGFGVGLCSGGVPLYISEIAPPKLRGRIIGIEQMVLCLGELIAFWLDYGFSLLESKDWWRIPLAVQILPAAILGVGCWIWVPPSPRWLVSQGRLECAREVLTRLHGSVRAEEEMSEIRAEERRERNVMSVGWLDMFKTPVLRVTMLGMGVQFFQQITGTNSILYYTPTLFEKGGIKDPSARNLATGGVGLVLFAASWIPIFVFDKIPRRTWLQLGTLGMMGSMLGIAALQSHAEGHPGDPANFTIIAFPYLFYVFFNISWGVGSWTYAAEIFPLGIRAKGSAFSTMSLWAACYIVAQASPVVEEKVGWGLYIIYAGVCIVAFLFVRYAMVETSGRTLEEMSRIFGIDSGFVERSGAESLGEDVDDDDGGGAGLIKHDEDER